MASLAPLSYSEDPTLFLYTSLTAGSSHIITATSRLETILKANKIPFRALDIATDEKARMIWGRRSKGRKLPGLVKEGFVIGDLDEIEEWNEYGELKQQLGATPAVDTTLSKPEAVTSSTSGPPSRASSETRHISISEPRDKESHDAGPLNTLKKDDTPLTLAMRQAGAEAAAKAGQKKTAKPIPSVSTEPNETQTTAPFIDPSLGKNADPETATEITAAKTPAQLTLEGAARTSLDKTAGSEGGTDASTSNEAQLLETRRISSISKTPSRLSTAQTTDQQPAIADTKAEFPGKLDEDKVATPDPGPRLHRGSSLSHGSKEEIKAMEEANKITEEEEPDEDAVEDVTRSE